jgi:adenylosuccinate lyase
VIDRYKNLAIRSVFSDSYKHINWRQIEVDYLTARKLLGDPDVTDEILKEVLRTPAPVPEFVAEVEHSYGHDVVAFLAAWTVKMSDATKSQVHLGLTSSDLVDTTFFEQLRAASFLINAELSRVHDQMKRFQKYYEGQTRPGRTHGQLAEPSLVSHRFNVWAETAWDLRVEGGRLIERLKVMKTPGAVGTARLLGMPVAQRVARTRQLTLVPSTQVIPRQRVVAWAAWCVQVVSLVEEIALEIRLSSRSEMAEMEEGNAARRIGSSAIPHKRNPIQSEQLSGLGRIARGYFAAVAETAGSLHHERDISNSSVERTVVPDLAELTAYMLNQVFLIGANLRVNVGAMIKNGRFLDSAKAQFQLQRMGIPYLVARRLAAQWVEDIGWDYDEVLKVVQEYRPEFEDASSFLDALDADIIHYQTPEF